jgi:hypothetical protein
VLIKVLEKALAVKSVLFNNFLESSYDVVNDCALFLARLSSTIVSVCASIVNYRVNLLFETFLCENLINIIAELPPFNVLSFFWCLEVGSQQIKFGRADDNLSHTESNSKLCVGDKTGPQLIEVSEELVNSDASLLADGANPGNHIVKVLRIVSNNIGLADSRLGLREVVKRVIEVSTYTVEAF